MSVQDEVRKWKDFFTELGIKMDIDTALKLMERVQFVKDPTVRSNPSYIDQKINEMRRILDDLQIGETLGDGTLNALIQAVNFDASRSDKYHVREAMKEDPRVEYHPKTAEKFVKRLPPPEKQMIEEETAVAEKPTTDTD